MLQWVWPIPLLIGVYFAPESPWNSVRRGKLDEAKASLRKLRKGALTDEREVEAAVAYMVHITNLERAETAGASFFEIFKGNNRRRTEIVGLPELLAINKLTLQNCVVWAAQILCGNAILGFAVVL
jgi:SP family general alpha glucoside:H+ symporter-like MFS transporter